MCVLFCFVLFVLFCLFVFFLACKFRELSFVVIFAVLVFKPLFLFVYLILPPIVSLFGSLLAKVRFGLNSCNASFVCLRACVRVCDYKRREGERERL